MLMQCFVHVKSQFRGKITGSSIEKFPFLVLPRNTTTVTAPYYPISSQLSVSGRLWEVKNKRKFQTFSSKSGRGRPREAVAYKRCPMQWFGRKTFCILENWSRGRGGRNWTFDCILVFLLIFGWTYSHVYSYIIVHDIYGMECIWCLDDVKIILVSACRHLCTYQRPSRGVDPGESPGICT